MKPTVLGPQRSSDVCRPPNKLCGEPDKVGNGKEVWRRLYLESEGGSKLVEYGGRKGFNTNQRCTKVADLHRHLDDWVDCL